jgi:hypothetical protein
MLCPRRAIGVLFLVFGVLPVMACVMAAKTLVAAVPDSTQEPGVFTQQQNPPHADSLASAPAAPKTPQRDVFDVIASLLGKEEMRVEGSETVELRGLSVNILPSIGYNSLVGGFFGASVNVAGWPRTTDPNRLSTLNVSATKATLGEFKAQLRSDLWFGAEDWILKGDWRYLDTTQPTYGLGPTSVSTGEYPMDFQLYRLYEVIYRRVSEFGYVGLGYQLNHHAEIVDTRAELGEETPFSMYSPTLPDETTSSGISLNILMDSRDSPIAASRGRFTTLTWGLYIDDLGSDETWQELTGELRTYTRLPKRSNHVLALWLTEWLTFGDAPYLDLPAIGWDTYGRSGRGYDQGQMRAPNQAYGEMEYRLQMTRDGLLGAVLFASATASTPPGKSFGRIDLAGGVGFRLKFTKETRMNLTADLAWAREGSRRVYLGMREAF